jgi:hypothetical protein
MLDYTNSTDICFVSSALYIDLCTENEHVYDSLDSFVDVGSFRSFDHGASCRRESLGEIWLDTQDCFYECTRSFLGTARVPARSTA